MENPIDPKIIEDLKRASQEIEGVEEVQPQVSEIPKEKSVEVSKKFELDLENHLSEIVEARKRLTEQRNKIQSKLQLVINLENRIRRVLSERKKLDEDLEKMKNQDLSA